MPQLKDYLYYKDDWATIYCGDCLEIMPLMEPESVDLVVTSPPFNLGNMHHTANKRHSPYDDSKLESIYQKEQGILFQQFYYLLKHGGWVFYNHKNRIKDGELISPYAWLFMVNFKMRQEVVWNNGSSNMDDCRFYPFTERIYCLSKGKAEFKNIGCLTDDWHISPVGTNQEHTRAFPVSLVKNCLISVPGRIVLDSYLGSGTTCVAAKNLNRKSIGIEINPKYCEIAVKRLRQEVFDFRKEKE